MEWQETMVNTIEPPVKPVAEAQPETQIPESQSETQPEIQLETVAQESQVAEAAETPVNPIPALEKKPLPEAPKRLLQRFEDFLVPALILFLVGNALAYALPDLAFAKWQIGVPFLLVFAGIVFVAAGKPENRWVIRIDLWMIALIAGSLFYTGRQFQPGPNDVSRVAPLARAEVMGTVLTHTSKNRVLVQVAQVDGKKVSGKMLVYLPSQEAQWESGTRVLMDGELSLPFENKIPGAFNQLEYLRSQHITALLKRPSRMIAFEVSNQPQYVLQRITDQLKGSVAATFAKSLPSPQSEVLGGIVLGDKAIPVDSKTKQAFIQTGLIHVLAASGMNVGIIAAAVLGLLALLKVPYRSRLLVAMAAVAFYSLLTGMPPSIQRAAAMLELALLLKLLNRELSPVFLLCVASTLLVLINPDNIASIGFQFSVLTTFGLVTMVAPLQEALGYYITRWVAGIILVPLIAQLWIWPLSVAYFNQFPIHTIPLNILALLTVTPLTILGFVAGVVSLILPPVGGWISMLARPFLDGLLWIVHAGNEMGWAQWSLPSPQPWQIAAIYAGLLVLLALTCRCKQMTMARKSWLGLLPVVVLLGGLCLENAQALQSTRIDMLPLSHRAEAIVVQPAQSDATVAIVPEDIGYFEARALADYFRHRHIERLGALLLLPKESGEPPQATNLKTAFKHVEIRQMLSATGTESVRGFSVKSRDVFTPMGARLNVGPLRLQGRLDSLRMLENRQCLLAIDARYQPASDAEGCGVRAVIGQDETRLFSQRALPTDRYYQLVHQGQELLVY